MSSTKVGRVIVCSKQVGVFHDIQYVLSDVVKCDYTLESTLVYNGMIYREIKLGKQTNKNDHTPGRV